MSHEVDEMYDVYNETWRRAIKPHECAACKRTIAKGERYARVFWIFDGEKAAIVRCVRCQTIHEHLRDLGHGETWPNEYLNCGEDYVDQWGHEPPEHIAALAFATPDEQHQIARVVEFRQAAWSHFYYERFRLIHEARS